MARVATDEANCQTVPDIVLFTWTFANVADDADKIAFPVIRYRDSGKPLLYLVRMINFLRNKIKVSCLFNRIYLKPLD